MHMTADQRHEVEGAKKKRRLQRIVLSMFAQLEHEITNSQPKVASSSFRLIGREGRISYTHLPSNGYTWGTFLNSHKRRKRSKWRRYYFKYPRRQRWQSAIANVVPVIWFLLQLFDRKRSINFNLTFTKSAWNLHRWSYSFHDLRVPENTQLASLLLLSRSPIVGA